MTHPARRHRGKFSRCLMAIPVPWVFVLAYLIGVGLEFGFSRSHSNLGAQPAGVIGVVLFVAGAVLAAWGWLIFRKARTTRVPGQASTTLVTWGPYRFTRNPMYVGLAVAYLGEAGFLRQVWPVFLLPLVLAYLNWIVIPVEEERMLEVFGAAYEAYRTRVGRWL